jgi:hypothetical protein
MLMPVLSDIQAVFPSERSTLIVTARQLNVWCASLTTLNATSPRPLRDLRQWAWRALAQMAALDVAAKERQRNNLLHQIRDRLRRAAVALATLYDLGLIERAQAELGRSLVVRLDDLLHCYPGEPADERTWQDERALSEALATEAVAAATGTTPTEAPKQAAPAEAASPPAVPLASDGATPGPRSASFDGRSSGQGQTKRKRRRRRR